MARLGRAQPFKPLVRNFYHFAGGGGPTQNLTASLFSNSDIFYGPTVSSTYALTPGLFSNTDIFYGPAVTAGAVDLSPALFSNTDIFYGPSITVGAANLSVGLFANSDSFFTLTVSLVGADQGLTPSLFSNLDIINNHLVGDAPEFDGFDVYYNGVKQTLSLIAEEFAQSGMGGIMKMKINDTVYSVQLTEVGAANASEITVLTGDGVKAIKLKE